MLNVNKELKSFRALSVVRVINERLTPELTRPAQEAFNFITADNDESHAIAGSG
jgi:hypothetical protein